MSVLKIILALFIAQIFCLFIPQTIFCQTETLDIVTYTPPKGWTKTPKEGAIVYTNINKTANTFCLLTVYASTPSAGSANKDFTDEWNKFVVTPFKAEANPKTDTQTNAEGWQATVGGTQIELDGGIKAAAVLTVFSGFGKTTSILAIFNNESYLAQVSALIEGIKLDKTKTANPTIQNNQNSTTQKDPFPDKPGVQPQQPLAGTLKETITVADLVGTWDNGGASVTTYVNSSSGNYSGTDTTFFTENYTIKPNGTFEKSFQGRTNNQTVREKDSGTITLSNGIILVKFNGRGTYRYQFIALMRLPNGGAVLTLYHLGDNDPLRTPEQLYWACGHPKGYITCTSGDEWVLRLGK